MKTKTLAQLLISIMLGTCLCAQDFNEVQRLTASDGEPVNDFGCSVSICGNYAIVGASGDFYNEAGSDSLYRAGSAYIFERDGYGIWHEVQKLVASDRAEIDYFGQKVSISGNNAIIGSPWKNDNTPKGDTIESAGSVYTFERDGLGTWHQMQKIVASDTAAWDCFGIALAISGNYAIIGAYMEDEDASGNSTLESAGSAYIFERDGTGTWSQVQKIVASDRAEQDFFGTSVSISGNYAIVGAKREDEDVTGSNTLDCAGSAYIFERDITGIWREVKKLVPSDRAMWDFFGDQVSISGNYVIVGVQNEDEDAFGGNAKECAGSVYVFKRDGKGNWQEIQKLVASDRAEYDLFGFSVAISDNLAIISAKWEGEDASGRNTKGLAGSAYIFECNESGKWNQIQKIVASDRTESDCFGTSVSISGDYAAVSARNGSDVGFAYLFESCEPSTETDPDNIIENGDFESCNLSPWQTYVYDPAANKVNAVLVDGECRLSDITISDPPETWHVQFLQTFNEQQKDKLEPGATYEFSFDAVAGAEKEVYVFFGQNEGDPWTACVNETIAVEVEKEHFSFGFTLNSVFPLMRVLFGFGHEPVGLTLDNVRLVKIIPSADNEMVVNDPAFHIYPNPAKDLLHIEAANGSEVKLITITGVVMKTIPVIDKIISMDIHELPEGMYLIKIAKDDFVTQHKIIIQ